METIHNNSRHTENTLHTGIHAIICYYFTYCYDLLEIVSRLEWTDKTLSIYDCCLKGGYS